MKILFSVVLLVIGLSQAAQAAPVICQTHHTGQSFYIAVFTVGNPSTGTLFIPDEGKYRIIKAICYPGAGGGIGPIPALACTLPDPTLQAEYFVNLWNNGQTSTASVQLHRLQPNQLSQPVSLPCDL